ncbi:MAG: hypothetical protein HY692_09635 [Cyanobacteria bacterium NC_groundwater_1444_Ag_S-0.65um_54_12]|nr:hypothetical protein [Cyanobacteria bacterium NC_groundwater_1444_Ag_S-0.65um_54_12]
MKIRSLATLLVLALATGCQLDGIIKPPAGNGSSNSTAKDKDKDAAPANKPLGKLVFQALSEQTAQKLGMLGGMPAPATGMRSAPVMAVAPAAPPAGVAEKSSAGGPVGSDNKGGAVAVADGPVNGSGGGMSTSPPVALLPISPYAYNSYVSSPLGQMKLASVTEAVAPGMTGGWKDISNQVIAPVLADWAADASLVHSNVTLDQNGDPLTGDENYPGELGWRIAYAAPSIQEALLFLITAQETRVVRLKWESITIAPAAIVVDSKEAVSRLVAALRDRIFRSKEEELGRDYFFGGSTGMQGEGNVGIAVPAVAVSSPGGSPPPMPLPVPDTAIKRYPPDAVPGTPDATSTPYVYYRYDYQEEPLYELAVGGRWNAQLQVINDYVVWELYYAPSNNKAETARPLPQLGEAMSGSDQAYRPADSKDAGESKPVPVEPESQSWVNGWASGMIDAKTGDVIRMRRPVKVTTTRVKVEVPVR